MKVYVLRKQLWEIDYHYFLRCEELKAFSSEVAAVNAMRAEVDGAHEKSKTLEKYRKVELEGTSATVSFGQMEYEWDVFELDLKA